MAGPISNQAFKVSASTPNCQFSGCPKCDNQGLALLVVRPGLANRHYAAQHAGSTSTLTAGMGLPELTAAGYVMRTLRQGYLMQFFPDNHEITVDAAAQSGWRVHRVDEGGYLTPATFGTVDLASEDEGFACSRTEGYAGAMLLTIPHPKSAGTVWIAFSSHPWSKPVRDFYASASDADRQRMMTRIDATNAKSNRSVELRVESLQSAVLDYVPAVPPVALEGTPFPRRMLAGDGWVDLKEFGFLTNTFSTMKRQETASDVQMRATAAMGLSTGNADGGKPMIVGVPDPEGNTTEAAQRRITLSNTAAEWIDGIQGKWDPSANRATKPGYRCLQSALSIKGLLIQMNEEGERRKQAEAAYADLDGKAVTRMDFNAMMKAGQLPKDAQFIYGNVDARSEAAGSIDFINGTIRIPADQDINATAKKVKEKLTATIRDSRHVSYNWEKFLETYADKVDADKKVLPKLELDHEAWLQSDARKQLTTKNFDEHTRADGLPYAMCVANMTLGGPMTDDAVGWWKDFLTEDPNAKDNILVRAMLGNQQDFYSWITDIDQESKGWDEAKGVADILIEARNKRKEAEVMAAHRAAGGHGEAATQTGTTANGQAGAHGGTGSKAGTDTHAQGAAAVAATEEEALVAAVGAKRVADLEFAAQTLLSTISSLAAKLDKAQQLSDGLRGKLRLLGIAMMEKMTDGLKLYKVTLPLNVVSRIWRHMVGFQNKIIGEAGLIGERQVKSKLMAGAMVLALHDMPETAEGVVDLYLWGRGDSAMTLGHGDGKFTLGLAEVTQNKGDRFAWKISEAAAKELAENSIRLLRGAATGLLSAGSGYLQILVFGAALKKLQSYSSEDRMSGTFGLVSSGLGISAAFMEINAGFAKQFEKELLLKQLKRAAGFAAAFATALDALQATLTAHSELDRGDQSAGRAHAVQAFLLWGAAFASGIAAYTSVAETSVLAGTLLGLSAGGWALVLVAAAVFVGVLAALVKDGPVVAWAAQTIWGGASKTFGSLEKEQFALNEVLLGVQIDYSYSSNSESLMKSIGTSLSDFMRNVGVAEMNQAAAASGEALTVYTHEAWLRLVIPAEVRKKMDFVMQIYGRREALVNKPGGGSGWMLVAQRGSSTPPIGDASDDINGIVDCSYNESSIGENDEAIAIVLSISLDMSEYRDTYAQIRIAAGRDTSDPMLINRDLIVDEDRIHS